MKKVDGVQAVNVTYPNGALSQDQLYYGGTPQQQLSVPDGGMTISLLGMALAGLGLVARRKK